MRIAIFALAFAGCIADNGLALPGATGSLPPDPTLISQACDAAPADDRLRCEGGKVCAALGTICGHCVEADCAHVTTNQKMCCSGDCGYIRSSGDVRCCTTSPGGACGIDDDCCYSIGNEIRQPACVHGQCCTLSPRNGEPCCPGYHQNVDDPIRHGLDCVAD